MRIIEKSIDQIKPYERNPRNNDGAVDAVAASIKEFGWKQPIVVDNTNTIIVGHTRYKAALKLGIQTIPCVLADDLTSDQINAYRLADNKTSGKSYWDTELLETELSAIDMDMAQFGFFDSGAVDWANVSDLTDSTYEPPTDTHIKCPSCGHEGLVREFEKVVAS